MRSVAVYAALAVAVLVVVRGSGAAGSAWIEGDVNGLPGAKGRVLASVRALDLTSSVVVAAQPLRSGRGYRLRVAPGRYLLAAGMLSGKRARRVLIGPLVARSGRTVAKDLRLPASARLRAGSLQGGGAVVGIGDLSVNSYPVEWYVIGQVLGPLHDDGARLVDETNAARAAIHRLQRLAANGRSEPFQYRPLKPEYRITADSGLERDGAAFFELRLEDVATGDVLATSGKVSGRQSDPIVATATSRFIIQMRKAIKRGEGGHAGGAPLIKIAIALRANCACGPGTAGTLTADPPGHTTSKNDATTRTPENLRLRAGTTVKLEAEAAPGYYLQGLEAACAYLRPNGTPRLLTPTRERQGRSATCKIMPVAKDSTYDIRATADFKPCPPNPDAYPQAQFPFLKDDCLGAK